MESFKTLPFSVSPLLEERDEFCFKMQTVDFQLRRGKNENNGKKRSQNPPGESQSYLCILLNSMSKNWLESDSSEWLSGRE